MISFMSLVFHVLVSPFKTQARLEAEIIMLRHQLNVLRRRVLAVADRLLFVWLYRPLGNGILCMELYAPSGGNLVLVRGMDVPINDTDLKVPSTEERGRGAASRLCGVLLD